MARSRRAANSWSARVGTICAIQDRDPNELQHLSSGLEDNPKTAEENLERRQNRAN